jgi:hypothetical protein
MVYDITNPQAPVFVDYNNTRNLTTYGGDNGPEITLYIAPENSPNGKPYVLVSNEISGTVTVFEVKNNRTPSAIAFNEATRSAREDAGTVSVRLNISPKAQTNGKVVLKRVNGANTTAADYTTNPAFINDSLTFNINQNDSLLSFNINILEDTIDEINETISFQMLSVTNGLSIANPNTLVFTIIDNDTLSNSLTETYGKGKMVAMYPNPTQTGRVYFSEAIDVEVLDLQGKSLLEAKATNEINVSNLAKGIYLVRMQGTITRKLIVE